MQAALRFLLPSPTTAPAAAFRCAVQAADGAVALTGQWVWWQTVLEDVLLRGVLRMEDERRADLQRWASSTPELAEIVRAVVSPLADLLDDDEGRCTLRVIAQVGALAEVGRTVTGGPVADTALQDQLEMLVSAATARCNVSTAGFPIRSSIASCAPIPRQSPPWLSCSQSSAIGDKGHCIRNAGGYVPPRLALCPA